jgi:L-serine dehydratase
MKEAIRGGQNPDLRSTSGLTGGDAAKMKAYAAGGGLTGSFLNHAMARAIAVSEYNAAMGKIVAAPTAGSCGILPGTVITMLDEGRCTEHDAVMALFTAGAIGMVIANQASVSGAQGGCQAECGSASAMAAAALVELAGGTPIQAAHGCAMAIKNQLGLVCDPVAGLVEIPCIKRNASGVAIAFTSAEMALAGIESKIPVDECILAMRQVGDMLPCSLKETAQGGLAATPTGILLRNKIFGADVTI